jgi:uncharacterized NAD(P)/FAD-binding protein YdhS
LTGKALNSGTRRPRIVIIGGGFSGAIVALNLLTKISRDAAEITIIEPRPVLGAGLAYSAPDPAHRVNVSAARLLVLPGEPGKFDDWLKSSGLLDDDPVAVLADGRAYPHRAVFGRYIDGELRAAAARPGAAPFRHIQAKALGVERSDCLYRVTLDDGGEIAADLLVLAVSHPAPGVPRQVQNLVGQEKFITDPWAPGIAKRIGVKDRVLIIGTALSTADIIATLDGAGHEGGIVAISRRGLVSRRRGVAQPGNFGDFTSHPSRTALALVQSVRRTIREAAQAGSCWEAVIETLREQGFGIWSALPEPEKKRFLRHVRPFWDVHRYQLAPPLADIMARKTREGLLEIRACRILGARVQDGRFLLSLLRRHAGGAQEEAFDVIVNCTGPDHSRILVTNPVLASLAANGMVRADRFGLGIATDGQARVIDSQGHANDTLYVAGPLARAAFGELMGLPQVSLHAAFVAERLVERMTREREMSLFEAPAEA